MVASDRGAVGRLGVSYGAAVGQRRGLLGSDGLLLAFQQHQVGEYPLTENALGLEDGATVNDFLTWFPGVTREQVEAVLEHAERSLGVA